MCSDRRKNHGVDRKNQKALALLGLASGPLPNAVNPSVVGGRTDNKDDVVEGKFSDLNFLPSNKKTTEYFFELLLSI